MTTIKRIRTLKNAGILADRGSKEQSPEFARFNLLYGFNGSGKSTVSRVFACLEAGKRVDQLPHECGFEIEMDGGAIHNSSSQLAGLEDRVCVFNNDFIERNLQWGVGRANSIFYISQEQADLAAELHAAQQSVPAGIAARAAQDKLVAASEKALKTYRTQRARVISGALHSGNRRYEAGQLQADYEKLPHGPESIVTADALDALIDVARLSAPPPALSEVHVPSAATQKLLNGARYFGDLSIGRVVLEELEKHPSMVPWIKEGHDYHTHHGLETCLHCGGALTKTREEQLSAALDDSKRCFEGTSV